MHKCGSQVSWEIAIENMPDKITIYRLIEAPLTNITSAHRPIPTRSIPRMALSWVYRLSTLVVSYHYFLPHYDVGNPEPL